MPLSWYVLHSKPNREDLLFSELRHREIETYYPRLRVNPVNPRARKVVPFFPGYLFIQVDLDQTSLSSLMWVPGANRMITFDYEPATVPADVIDALKEKVSAINSAGGDQKNRLKHGDPIRIKSGPFKGYDAIFDQNLDGTSRVRVLIKMLRDRQMRLEVPEGLVSPQQS